LLTNNSVAANPVSHFKHLSRFDMSFPFWVTAFAIAAWSAVAAWINPAQFADNLEQFSWSHSLELGYWKHPPLPTWLIAIPIRLFGFSVYWTYALAAICFIGTVFFTWRITRRLFGYQAATFAALLIGLHIGFSWRAQLYNHNTVLLLFSAASVWATLRALDSGRKLSWLYAGMLAGLAMLSKYQAIVPLVGIVIALYTGGWLKQRSVVQGLAIAAITAFAVFLPHLIWIVMGSGSTINNAFHSAENLGFSRRLIVFMGFWLIQVRFHFPLLVAVSLLVLFKTASAVEHVVNERPQQHPRAWFLGLVAWPALFVSMAVLLGGMRLEAQWGLQTFQFVVIFVAWKLALMLPKNGLKRTVSLILVMQVVLAGFFAWSVVQPGQQFWQGQRSRNFPATDVAKEISSKWYEATSCPLKYVVGPSFEATVVSAYSGDNPIVLEDGDFKKSPWVSSEQLKEFGALYLAGDAAYLPHSLATTGQMTIPARVNDFQPIKQLFWGITLPQTNCK
jgi:4-amino-4-deoxy-L-arabinose transferase-like glycosyltransferase